MESTVPDKERKHDAIMLQQALVDNLKMQGSIATPSIEEAFRTVPRHLFLPGVALETAYSDSPVFTKRQGEALQSCSSQPTIMAKMLEMLDLRPGLRILEIGTGTGYNAALMAHIVGDTGHTVDIDEDIIISAREHLKDAGYEHVQVVHGDGGWGYAAAAPYDRIILTVGASDIVPAWHEQLTPNGRLIIPLELTPFRSKLTMHLVVTLDHAQNCLMGISAYATKFVLLRGFFAPASNALTALGPHPGLTLATNVPINAADFYRALTALSYDETTNVRITLRELDGLYLWLALQEFGFGELYVEGDLIKRNIVPLLIEVPDRLVATFGVCEQSTMSVLLASFDTMSHSNTSVDQETPFDLLIRTFGPEITLAQRLVKHIHTWERVGRPFVPNQRWTIENLQIRVYSKEKVHQPLMNEVIIDKQWVRLALKWS